jgi:hypothetical protein
VHLCAVFQHDHVFALRPEVTKLCDCLAAILQQPFFIRRIYPSMRHDPRAVARSDLIFKGIH